MPKNTQVYIIEYKVENGFISKAISLVTGQKYSHTAMVIGNTWYELDAIDEYKGEPDYHKKEYKNIDDFLLNNPEKERTEAYWVPWIFNRKQIVKMEAWWDNKIISGQKYGYAKLISFLPYMILKRIYRAFNKPYSPKFDIVKQDVCSVAVDTNVTKVGGYDMIPNSPERFTYPGLAAHYLREYHYEAKTENVV